jgi:hypothetical protein
VGPKQKALSVTRACHKKHVTTVDSPEMIGPPMWGMMPVTMGQVCKSIIRDAGGMGFS